MNLAALFFDVARRLPQQPVVSGYDPNIDIVQAAIYGGVRCDDPQLLATAAMEPPPPRDRRTLRYRRRGLPPSTR